MMRRGVRAALGLSLGVGLLAGVPGVAQEPRGLIEESVALDNNAVRVSLLTFAPPAPPRGSTRAWTPSWASSWRAS